MFWRVLNTLFVLAILLVGVWAYFQYFPSPITMGPVPPNQDPCRSMLPRPNQQNASSLGVTLSQGKPEYVGVSDGSFIFDTGQRNKGFKCSGAIDLREQHRVEAETAWTDAILSQKPPRLRMESNDAEALIYRENSYVLDTGLPYINIIVGSILTGDDAYIGRDFLQGVYVAQEEFNRHHPILVRLLVANFSNNVRENPATGQLIEDQVARQLVTIAQTSGVQAKGIVLGLPFLSGNTLNILDQGGIPVILSGPFSEAQIAATKNIFPVSASIEREGEVGASYVKYVLNAKHIAVFVDHADAYSQNLAQAFEGQFSTHIPEEVYSTVRKDAPANIKAATATIVSGVQDALNNGVDLIYFAGDSRNANILVEELQRKSAGPNLRIMGGDALYELGGYTTGKDYRHLDFTSFSFPDEWEMNHLPQPQFIDLYRLLFAGWPPSSGTYGYSRPDNDVILSYDALSVLLEGCEKPSIDWTKTNFSPTEVQAMLTNISGQQAFQGFSGRISFDNDLHNKAIVVLSVDQDSLTHEVIERGCLQVTPCTQSEKI